jgi:hypothetical protein
MSMAIRDVVSVHMSTLLQTIPFQWKGIVCASLEIRRGGDDQRSIVNSLLGDGVK